MLSDVFNGWGIIPRLHLFVFIIINHESMMCVCPHHVDAEDMTMNESFTVNG